MQDQKILKGHGQQNEFCLFLFFVSLKITLYLNYCNAQSNSLILVFVLKIVNESFILKLSM